MKSPRRAYVFGREAFVPHPAAKGLWVKTHRCVAFAPCPYCKSPVGVPCRGTSSEYVVHTHTARREEASGKKQEPSYQVIEVRSEG